MEHIFRPTKWFVLFCALLVVVWGILQLVANLRIAEEAKVAGARIFTWDWPDRNLSSWAEITRADVVRRTETDAIVNIVGRQALRPLTPGKEGLSDGGGRRVLDCKAKLTFYRLSNKWELGKVELP